jgi:hypothetical protein
MSFESGQEVLSGARYRTDNSRRRTRDFTVQGANMHNLPCVRRR